MKSTLIFSQKYEKFYHVLLASFLLLAVASWVGVIPSHVVESRLIQFMMTIVLLDGIHVIFTVITLFFLPEFRRWLRGHLSARGWIFGLVMIAIFANAVLKQGPFTFPVLVFNGGMTFALSRMHRISQLKGLSLLYNKTNRPSLSEQERLIHDKVEWRERILFGILVGAVFFDRLSIFIFDFKHSVKMIYLCVSLLISVAIFANACRYPRVNRSSKRFFLSNGFLLSLSLYYPFINMLQKSLHGFEYIFLTLDMTSRSEGRRSRAWFAKVVAVIALHLVVLLYSFHFISQKKWLASSLVAPVFVAHFFFDFFHYYVDSLVFRFGDPLVRENVMPLVLASAEAAPTSIQSKAA